MKYINVKTGNVIDVSGRVSGGDWQAYKPAGLPVSGGEKEEIAPAQKKPAAKKTKG